MIPNNQSIINKPSTIKHKTSNSNHLTIKQSKTIKLLPNVNNNMSNAMRLSGYSEQSLKSAEVRNSIKSHIVDFFTPDKIKADSAEVYQLAKKKLDCTNMQRNTEFRANVAGMITQKVDQNVNMSGELTTINKDTPEDELFTLCKNIKARRAIKQ